MNIDISFSERALILAPQGRDAALARSLLSEAMISSEIVSGLSDLVTELDTGAAVVLLAEEAIIGCDLGIISRWLQVQPAWSDLAFILLVRHGGGPERNPAAVSLSEVLGNVTFLERPFHPTTLISVVQTALRGRRRQYEARSRLDELRINEEKLRELNATLEERVAKEVDVRSAAEDALRQSQKMEAVGQLTGGVAHDFNNLLTIIRSSVDLLRRPGLSDERKKKYMDAVSDTVERAAKLTGQLLAFARRQTLQPTIFNVAECLIGLVEMLVTVTGARVKVNAFIEQESCYIKADISQFETAIINMAVNARDAMNGEGSLTLFLDSGIPMPGIRGHAGEPGPFIIVTLTDTGHGIAPDQLSRIFEPFYTTKGIGKGTGLGLSQVFGFAKQSGGNITVDSKLGQGTTFRLYLPQVDQSTDRVPQPLATQMSVSGEGLSILIVEDNLEVGQFATQILQDLGYMTTWTKNAEEALQHLRSHEKSFDVMFSDVVMPGMNGVDLAVKVRRIWPKIPIVLASGYSEVLAREGTHGFELLPKPYSADEVSVAFQRAIQKQRNI